MNVSDRIAYDVECMRDYFRQLIAFAQSAAKPFAPEPSGGQGSTQFLPIGITHLVRPDMACNVYSLSDFWLSCLCTYHQERGKLQVSFDAFKKFERKSKQNDLQRYRKYLTKVAGLNLTSAQSSFAHLDALREVRNTFIHGGGHAPEGKRAFIANIPGVSVQASLIVITEAFIWSSLDHASQYLQAVARA